MNKILIAYAFCVFAFLLLDGLWLLVIAKGMYRTHLGFLMADSPNLWAAFAFYLLFTVGLMVFVIVPALADMNAMRALCFGAFFGLVTYGTYDLTNHATVKGWPAIITAIDLCWGAFLTGTVSFIVVTAIQKIYGSPN